VTAVLTVEPTVVRVAMAVPTPKVLLTAVLLLV
jgi:hypothetical protein